MSSSTHPSQSGANRAKVRIMIVEDHPLMCEGLIHAITRDPTLTVCGEAHTAAEALDAFETLNPDLVIADISLPGRNGIEMIRDIRAIRPDVRVLVLSMHDEALYAERALRAGARGYLMKQEVRDTLLKAIHQILAGRIYVSEKMSARILENVAGQNAGQSAVGKLSDRELEVFRLIGQGRNTVEIADDLHLSVKTVETHRAHIKEKLALKNMSELISYASRWYETEDGTGGNGSPA